VFRVAVSKSVGRKTVTTCRCTQRNANPAKHEVSQLLMDAGAVDEFVEAVPVRFGTMHRIRFGARDFKLIEPLAVPPSALQWSKI